MAQLQLISSVSHLTAIINSVPTALVMIDAQGTIVLVNTQSERLFGYSSEQLLGESVELLVPQRFRAGHPTLRSDFFSNPTARPMGTGRDLFGLRRDGSEFPIEIGLNPIHTEEGLFVVSAIVDITERKRLEARFRSTVESAPTAMIMVDTVGMMVLVNSETERLFAYEPGELLNKKVEMLIPPRYRPTHPQMRVQFFAQPQARRMGEGRDLFGLRKDGVEFPIEIGLNPLRNDEGSFVLAAIIDLTERKRSEEQLRKANEALEESNLELKQFAYIASHDLQTPLRAISGFSQCLSNEYHEKLETKAAEYLGRIVTNVGRMQTLVDDLLNYSRVESRSQPFSVPSLQDALDDALLMLEVSIADTGCQVTWDELPVVCGDRSQLSQLFQNLLGNAVKFRSARDPQVHIAAERQGDQWLVSVRDNGIGIEEHQLEKIFEIFTRLHDQKTYPGTGIGLAVCRRIVLRHGGKIWAESKPGVGSTFFFTLPMAVGAPEVIGSFQSESPGT
jgi:PAS domain S-box-containing protein